MSTQIAIKQLVKSYPAIAPAPGAPPTTTAVDRVSLTINPGELFFLLGPSGCGKTTLLRMIAGFIEPTSGNIEFIDGSRTRDVTFLPAEQRDTGMVFQSYALWPHMTVAQNVAFGLEVRGIPKAEREQRVRAALAQVRMEQYGERKPTQLSGGQQQRVALARAMVVRPQVLLLDEPLSNLDAKLRVELRTEIRRICKESGITTVYVTHDQKEALSIADRMAIMRAGVLEQVGSPRELYRRPANRFVAEFLGDINLVEGTVSRETPKGVVVDVGGWMVEGVSTQSSISPGSRCLVGIRPEAMSATSTSTNAFDAEITEQMYLGEIAVVGLRGPGGLRLHMSLLNPSDFVQAQSRVRIGVAPDDVIVLPAT
jgi:iron(III) transport system ATP-binding protein